MPRVRRSSAASPSRRMASMTPTVLVTAVGTVQYGIGMSQGEVVENIGTIARSGTRRFLDENKSSRTVGFRCAMTRKGGPTGNGEPDGNMFKTKRKKERL